MRIPLRSVRLLLALALAGSAWPQDEAALRRFFEGRAVRVKLDLPGTHQGVDIHWRQDPPLDAKSYTQRVKNFPRALAAGDVTRVTTVRVKAKNIEFHLGGGGYGTLGDDTSSVTAPGVSKTRREEQLERDVNKETDRRRRDEMNRELSRLQSERRREESRLRAHAAELNAIKQSEIMERRRQGGSRFNLWFPDKYLQESVPTPEQLMAMLGEWVDFSPLGAAPAQPVPQPPAAGPLSLRRGLTRDEVRNLLGQPAATRRRMEGTLAVETEVFETPDQVTEVDYVEGIVVKFRASSK